MGHHQQLLLASCALVAAQLQAGQTAAPWLAVAQGACCQALAGCHRCSSRVWGEGWAWPLRPGPPFHKHQRQAAAALQPSAPPPHGAVAVSAVVVAVAAAVAAAAGFMFGRVVGGAAVAALDLPMCQPPAHARMPPHEAALVTTSTAATLLSLFFTVSHMLASLHL